MELSQFRARPGPVAWGIVIIAPGSEANLAFCARGEARDARGIALARLRGGGQAVRRLRQVERHQNQPVV